MVVKALKITLLLSTLNYYTRFETKKKLLLSVIAVEGISFLRPWSPRKWVFCADLYKSKRENDMELGTSIQDFHAEIPSSCPAAVTRENFLEPGNTLKKKKQTSGCQ